MNNIYPSFNIEKLKQMQNIADSQLILGRYPGELHCGIC